ncbi:hypothetical protein ACRTDI_23375, partial [Vibrio fluvialis]
MCIRDSLFDLLQLREYTEHTVEPLILRTDVEGIDPVSYTHLTLPTTRSGGVGGGGGVGVMGGGG